MSEDTRKKIRQIHKLAGFPMVAETSQGQSSL